jgi:hypothetical protein
MDNASVRKNLIAANRVEDGKMVVVYQQRRPNVKTIAVYGIMVSAFLPLPHQTAQTVLMV